MTALQRRALWLCVLGFAFIFWYEASGVALTWASNAPVSPRGEAAWTHFWSHLGYGAFFLAAGALLTVLLRPRGEKAAPYHWGDWLGLACGLGLLAGTLFRSYRHVLGGA